MAAEAARRSGGQRPSRQRKRQASAAPASSPVAPANTAAPSVYRSATRNHAAVVGSGEGGRLVGALKGCWVGFAGCVGFDAGAGLGEGLNFGLGLSEGLTEGLSEGLSEGALEGAADECDGHARISAASHGSGAPEVQSVEEIAPQHECGVGSGHGEHAPSRRFAGYEAFSPEQARTPEPLLKAP